MKTKNNRYGTVPPCGAIGSVVFTPDIVEETVRYYFEHVPQLWGYYGFKDAFNLDRDWVSRIYIGIDKGIELLMIENYKTGLLWDITMRNKYIKDGLQKLSFHQTNKKQKKSAPLYMGATSLMFSLFHFPGRGRGYWGFNGSAVNYSFYSFSSSILLIFLYSSSLISPFAKRSLRISIALSFFLKRLDFAKNSL